MSGQRLAARAGSERRGLAQWPGHCSCGTAAPAGITGVLGVGDPARQSAVLRNVANLRAHLRLWAPRRKADCRESNSVSGDTETEQCHAGDRPSKGAGEWWWWW